MRFDLTFHHGQSMTAVLALGLALGASLYPTSAPMAADAGQPATGVGGLVTGVLESLDIKTTLGPKPGFVEATHPDPSSLKFIPTGTPHPKRTIEVKSTDDIEAAKAALDAAREAQLKPKGVPPPKGAKKAKAAKPAQTASAATHSK